RSRLLFVVAAGADGMEESGHLSSGICLPRVGLKPVQATRREGKTGVQSSAFQGQKEISDKCRPKERGDAGFTIKRWKRSISPPGLLQGCRRCGRCRGGRGKPGKRVGPRRSHQGAA